MSQEEEFGTAALGKRDVGDIGSLREVEARFDDRYFGH
jgi:hypothetical protein